jgi:glycerol-3-phosphate dehydrogenase
VEGVELCGTLKNVVALAAGLLNIFLFLFNLCLIYSFFYL